MAKRKKKNNIDTDSVVGTCGTCVGYFIIIALVVGLIEEIVKKLDETFGIKNVLIFVACIGILLALVLSTIIVKKQWMRIIAKNTDDYLWKTTLNIDGQSVKARIDKYNLQRQVIDTPELGILYLEAAMLLTRDNVKDIETLRKTLRINRKKAEELIDMLQRGHIITNESYDEIESISYSSFIDYLENPYVLYDNNKIYFTKIEKHYGTVIEGNKKSSLRYIHDKNRPNVSANLDSYFFRQVQNVLITSSDADTEVALIRNAFCIVNDVATVLFTINSGTNKVCLVNNEYNSVSGLDTISDAIVGNIFFDFLIREIEWRENKLRSQKVSNIEAYNRKFQDFSPKSYYSPQIDRILVIVLDAEIYLRDCTKESYIFKIIKRGFDVGVQVILSTRLTAEQIFSNRNAIPIQVVKAIQVKDMLSNIDLCVHRSITGNRSDDRIYPRSVVTQFITDEQTRMRIEKGLPTGEFIPVSVIMTSQLSNKVTDNVLITHDIYPDFENAQKETGKTLSEVDRMTGVEFEFFCKEILSKNGFKDIIVTKASRDYGADLTAKKDGIKYVIQCKRYSGNVGEDSVREVYASKKVYDAEIAVVLTNSHFTDAAYELAKHNHVHLWHRRRLALLMKEANNCKKDIM